MRVSLWSFIIINARRHMEWNKVRAVDVKWDGKNGICLWEIATYTQAAFIYAQKKLNINENCLANAGKGSKKLLWHFGIYGESFSLFSFMALSFFCRRWLLWFLAEKLQNSKFVKRAFFLYIDSIAQKFLIEDDC